MTSGWQGALYFRRYGRELVLKTGDFVQETLGGATVVRLTDGITLRYLAIPAESPRGGGAAGSKNFLSS